MGRLARRIADERVLGLIRRYLDAGVLAQGMVIERHEGTPQGGPLSPLLANVLLDEVDKELEKRGHAFVRYADDLNVYVRVERLLTALFAHLLQNAAHRRARGGLDQSKDVSTMALALFCGDHRRRETAMAHTRHGCGIQCRSHLATPDHCGWSDAIHQTRDGTPDDPCAGSAVVLFLCQGVFDAA
jgi:hypothetical protein